MSETHSDAEYNNLVFEMAKHCEEIQFLRAELAKEKKRAEAYRELTIGLAVRIGDITVKDVDAEAQKLMEGK